jgi:hypothetical protein
MTWLNEKPNTEGLRLIERLSTEFEVFLVLLSAVIAADVSLYFYEKQNILTFNWKFGGEIKGGEINIGAILIFILLFSFMMTFVSGLFVVALKFVWGELPYKLTSRIDRNRDFDYSKHCATGCLCYRAHRLGLVDQSRDSRHVGACRSVCVHKRCSSGTHPVWFFLDPGVKDELADDYGESWVLYPPLAGKTERDGLSKRA